MKTGRVLFVLAAFAAGCSTLTVSTDWDHTVDFAQYKTFALQEGTKAENSLVQRRIESALIATLESRGLAVVSDSPALLVYPHVRVTQQKQVNYSDFGYGGWYGWDGWGTGGWASNTATVSEVPVGTLSVDLVDAQKKTLVWRGTATDTITNQGDVSQKNVDAAVATLLKGFPPVPPAAGK
jgi:hypothetical protein